MPNGEKLRENSVPINKGDVFWMRSLPSLGEEVTSYWVDQKRRVMDVRDSENGRIVALEAFEQDPSVPRNWSLVTSRDDLRGPFLPPNFTLPEELFIQLMVEGYCVSEHKPKRTLAPSLAGEALAPPVRATQGEVLADVHRVTPRMLPPAVGDTALPPEELTTLSPFGRLDEPLVGLGSKGHDSLLDSEDILRAAEAAARATEEALVSLESVTHLRPNQINERQVRGSLQVLTTNKHLVKGRERGRVIAVNARLVEIYNASGLKNVQEAIRAINAFLDLPQR